MSLHGKIMNLQFVQPSDVAWTVSEAQAAKLGHRDARHAAAELALAADACIETLRTLVRGHLLDLSVDEFEKAEKVLEALDKRMKID